MIAHQLWEYCKINYTSQKTKNIIEIQASKYKQIAEDMERNMNAVVVVNTHATKNESSPLPSSHFLPLEEKEWIQTELTTFIDTL